MSQQEIYDCLKENEYLSTSDLIRLTGKPRQNINKHVSTLLRQGYILSRRKKRVNSTPESEYKKA